MFNSLFSLPKDSSIPLSSVLFDLYVVVVCKYKAQCHIAALPAYESPRSGPHMLAAAAVYETRQCRCQTNLSNSEDLTRCSFEKENYSLHQPEEACACPSDRRRLYYDVISFESFVLARE